MLKNFYRVIQFTLILAASVILLGAFTRLKDAGLGCPDWPGCYGRIFVPSIDTPLDNVATYKAWIEMSHRYIAGLLGLLILYITVQSFRLRATNPKLWICATGLLLLVIFQAALGMWTVTMKLNPLVVMGHLLGGIAIITLLWWIYLNLSKLNVAHKTNRGLQRLAYVCFGALICQIALGGWTSANYAAVVCADFPACQGSLWPAMDWRHAFSIPSAPLDNAARVTIQMAHRIGALCVTLLLTFLGTYILHGSKLLRRLGIALFALLGIQVILGITNVLGGLPLMVSLAHNGVAILLLLCLLTILYVNAKPHHS